MECRAYIGVDGTGRWCIENKVCVARCQVNEKKSERLSMSGDEQRGDHFYFREFAGKHTLMFSAPSPISVAGDTNIHLSLRSHDGEGHKFSTALFRIRLGVAALTTPSFRIQIKIAVISLGSLCTIRQSAHVSPSSLYIRRREAITVFILQTPGQRPPFRHVFSTPEQLNFFFLHQGLKY